MKTPSANFHGFAVAACQSVLASIDTPKPACLVPSLSDVIAKKKAEKRALLQDSPTVAVVLPTAPAPSVAPPLSGSALRRRLRRSPGLPLYTPLLSLAFPSY